MTPASNSITERPFEGHEMLISRRVSRVMSWYTGAESGPKSAFDGGTAALTEISRQFAQFVAEV